MVALLTWLGFFLGEVGIVIMLPDVLVKTPLFMRVLSLIFLIAAPVVLSIAVQLAIKEIKDK